MLFCSGDGTARDICGVTGETTPILGIPSGVKMYSGVFGVTPGRTADILMRYLAGEIGLADAEMVDLDEEKYRRDEWAVRLYIASPIAIAIGVIVLLVSWLLRSSSIKSGLTASQVPWQRELQ